MDVKVNEKMDKTRTRITFGRQYGDGGRFRSVGSLEISEILQRTGQTSLWLGFMAWAWLRGICHIEFDKHTQKISCEVNKPIC